MDARQRERALASTASPGAAPTTQLHLVDGPVLRSLVAYCAPGIVSSGIQALNASVTALWIGRFLGEAALTAATNATSLAMFFVQTCWAGVAASGVMIGHATGAQDQVLLKRVVGSCGMLLAMVAVALALAAVVAARPLLMWLEIPEKVLRDAHTYAVIAFFACVPMLLSMFLTMALRSTGDAKTPFKFSVGCALTNLMLTPLLILGAGPIPALGVAGGAVALLVSQLATLVSLVWVLNRHKHVLSVWRERRRYLRLDTAILLPALRRGVPMGLTPFVISGSALLLLVAVNRFGLHVAAAYSALLQLWTYLQMPLLVIGMSLSVMVAQNKGAASAERLPTIARAGVILCCLVALMSLLLLYSFAGPLIAIFLPKGSPSLSVALEIHRTASWSFLLFAAGTALLSVVRGAGAVLWPLVIVAVSELLIRVPFALLGSELWGASAIWWSMPVGFAAALLMASMYYRWGKWREIDPLS